jgi:hypothetical protein
MQKYLITVFRKGSRTLWAREFESQEENAVSKAIELVFYAVRNHATWVAGINFYRLEEGRKRVPVNPTWLAMVKVINKLKHRDH